MPIIDKLANGVTVIVEEMPHVQSASYEIVVPGGVICDPADKIGSSLVLAELTARGAGDLDSRSLSEAYDDLGIRHGENVGGDKFMYRGSLYYEHLDRALELASMMVLKPKLPGSEIDNIRNVLLQDIASLSDSPARLALVELGRRYYPDPHGRSGIGTVDGLKACTEESLKNYWRDYFKPSNAIISIAGKVKAKEAIASVSKYFLNWNGEAPKVPKLGELPKSESFHIEFDSAQLQIAIAYPSARFGEKYYYSAKVAAQVLSGGMFGRLFIEVREKRGLCYSVYCRHSATNEYGTMQAYAGTTPERAHDTLEVMLAELRGLAGTVTDEELKRAKANLKASLIIGEESPGSRGASN